MGIKIRFVKGKEENVLKTIKIPMGKKTSKKTDDSSGFILKWEQQLGFSEDPFKKGIMEPISDTIVNLEKEKEALNMFIVEKGKCAMVIGNHSTGKTVLLKWLKEKLKRYKHEIVTTNIKGREVETNNLDNILLRPFKCKNTKNKPIDKILKQKLGNKRYVLLIDDLRKLTKEMTSLFNKLFTYLELQIIVTSLKELEIPEAESEEIDCFSDSLKISLKGMSFGSAKEMVKKRMIRCNSKRFYPFDDELFKKIWNESNKNPVEFLELCRKKAIGFAIKKSKGMNLDDVRSYEKDGIDVSKIEFKEESSEDAKKGNGTYKIEVINRGSQDIIIDDMTKKDSNKKLKYTIKKGKHTK